MNSGGTNISRERIAELGREHIAVMPYDPAWPARYAEEEERLSRSLPPAIIRRIAHIGSTAVPGLSAKPIIDIQVEVTSLDRVRREVVPIMQDLDYEFIWRPSMGERAPFYAWFIKRDAQGQRTFHVHMVEPDEASTDRLIFRDFLRKHPLCARDYEALKHRLASEHPADRESYTRRKTPFIQDILRRAHSETDRSS
ncbi:MAG: GrpB family protein [Flavobacteriales bacterium]|nr:GrpB family protein [Flavobacteriales bacterium]